MTAMRGAALCLILAAGCHGGGPPTVTNTPNHVDIPIARTTPPPTVGWNADERSFVLNGLPANARAGEVTVAVWVDFDAPSHEPVLNIQVRDRDDKTIESTSFHGIGEFSDAKPEDLARKLADANKRLETLHGVHDLQAMHKLELDEERDFATGDNLDVEFRTSHVRVFRHNDTRKPLADRDGTSWIVGKTTPYPDVVCNNDVFLRAVFHAPGTNSVMVDVGYKGTDSCSVPPDQVHVITWL